ncbi:MAG: hypothetical protein J7M11_03710, partial [Elusimicrobia bacterium]|nr:hypothetical protein [Elusimicrobiota bacterium]
MNSGIKIKRALISVSGKKGLAAFARALASQGVELLATGGTYNYLKDRNIPVKKAASEPLGEILSGRVKTLSRKIFAGILADNSNASHMAQIKKLKIKPIELVCVTPYKLDKLPENIDIGGIALLRAAAKNCGSVTAVCNPKDYQLVISQIRKKGFIPRGISEKLALKVFKLTSEYDKRILRLAGAPEAAAGDTPLK